MLEILEWTDKSVGYAGCSLGVGDRRIIRLLHRILWRIIMKELRSFIIILLLLFKVYSPATTIRNENPGYAFGTPLRYKTPPSHHLHSAHSIQYVA